MSQNKFLNTQRNKFVIGDKNLGPLDQQRGKTSSSPTRMPIIKDNFHGSRGLNPIVPNLVTNYNTQNLNILDKDKMHEEMIKNKTEMNKKNKDFHSLKIAYSKLENENKKNVKIIEEILEEASKQKTPGEEVENDIKNIIANSNLPMNSFMKLREVNKYLKNIRLI
jgi:predicted DNA-binding ArsR family transcriptional regulator